MKTRIRTYHRNLSGQMLHGMKSFQKQSKVHPQDDKGDSHLYLCSQTKALQNVSISAGNKKNIERHAYSMDTLLMPDIIEIVANSKCIINIPY